MEGQTPLDNGPEINTGGGKTGKGKWIGIGIAVIVVLGGVGVAMARPKAATGIQSSNLYKVKSAATQKTIKTVGTVQSKSEVNLAFQGQGGRVTSVKVKVGDKVKAGQVVATLDDSSTQAQLQQAEAGLSQAQGALAQAQAGVVKTTEGPTSATVSVAQSNVNKAKTALAAAQKQYQDQLTAYNDRTVAKEQLTQAQNAYQQAKTALQTAQQNQQQAVQAAQKKLKADQNNLQTLKSNLDQAKSNYGNITKKQVDQAYQKYQTALNRFKSFQNGSFSGPNPYEVQMKNYQAVWQSDNQGYTALQNAQNAYNQGEALVQNDQSALTQAQNGVSQAQAQFDAAKKALASAQATYNDRTQAKQALDAAKTQVNQAKAALKEAQASYQQTVQPPDKGSVASANAAVQTAQAQVKTAQAQVKAAKLQESYMTLRAPVAGIITTKNIQVGDQVSPGQPAFVLDVHQLQVNLPVSESQLPLVHNGDTVQVTVPEDPGQTFTGKVFQIDPTPIQGNGSSFKVEATIQDPKHQLKPGMTGHTTIHLSNSKNAVIVPAIAMHTVNGQQGVYLYDTSTKSNAKVSNSTTNVAGMSLPPHVIFKRVVVSSQGPYQDEVSSGLKNGDKILLGQGSFLVGSNGTIQQN